MENWKTFHAMWRCNATSTTPEIQRKLDGLYSTGAKRSHAHGTVPKQDADSLKRSLSFWFEDLKNGWASKTSKDGFVYTQTHKASGTAITYTKVATVWVFIPDFTNEEQELAHHLRNVEAFYFHCAAQNNEWVTEAIRMALRVHTESLVTRVVGVLTEEWGLKRMARERGNPNDWRHREEPLTRPNKK